MIPLVALILAVLINQVLTFMKLSQLNAELVVISKQVDTLIAGQNPNTDPDLPADLEATVAELKTKLAAVPPAP